MVKVTVQFGSGQLTHVYVPTGTTIGTLLAMPSLQAELGFGKNVQALVGNVPQSNETQVRDGMVVVVTTKECGKAS